MAELNEQQTHLASLLKQREEIVSEINELTAKAESKKELLLRTLGAVEYLQQVGVKLPEPEEAKMTDETPEVEGEVVVVDHHLEQLGGLLLLLLLFRAPLSSASLSAFGCHIVVGRPIHRLYGWLW